MDFEIEPLVIDPVEFQLPEFEPLVFDFEPLVLDGEPFVIEFAGFDIKLD